MVSPLTIWQHPQPKYLWPLLGGLSVLAHVGVLGLSLPYMLTLMQSAGDASVSSTIPIELVSGEDTAQTTPESAATLKSRDEQFDSSAIEASQIDTTLSSEETTAFDASDSDSELDGSQSSPIDQTMSDYNNSQVEDPPIDHELVEGRSNGSTALPVSTSPAPTSPRSPNSTPSPPEPPTIIGGGSDLPGPNQGPREVSLSIVSAHAPPPEIGRNDGKETSPSLSSDSADFVALNPESSDCDSVDFSSREWTYRVAVNPDGLAAQFTLFNEEPGRESDAIACLLKSAGFTFTPAEQDGTPILDDYLILTIQVQ